MKKRIAYCVLNKKKTIRDAQTFGGTKTSHSVQVLMKQNQLKRPNIKETLRCNLYIDLNPHVFAEKKEPGFEIADSLPLTGEHVHDNR